MRPPQRLAVLLGSWALVAAAVVAATAGGLEVLLILVLVGTLVLRELVARGLSARTRGRVDVLVVGLALLFAVVVVQDVRRILAA